MPEITLIIQHEVGLHARPAAQFVQTAKQFNCDIKVTHGQRNANAKSILTLLGLGASQGAEITIQADGEDAQQALAALTRLVKTNFEEGP